MESTFLFCVICVLFGCIVALIFNDLRKLLYALIPFVTYMFGSIVTLLPAVFDLVPLQIAAAAFAAAAGRNLKEITAVAFLVLILLILVKAVERAIRRLRKRLR